MVSDKKLLLIHYIQGRIHSCQSSVRTLNDEDIIQEVLNHHNELETEDNSDAEDTKSPLKENEYAYIYFINNSINIRVDDLSVVRRLISHVIVGYGINKQSSIEKFSIKNCISSFMRP